MASRNFKGAIVNGSGTRIAAIRAIGTATAATTASNEAGATVPHGSMRVDVKSAINMGILDRNASGVLVELNPPAAHTRVG